MKSVYKLLPFLFVFLMAISAYSLISGKVEKQATYNTHIKVAESYYKDGIIVDAVSSLDLANDMKPSIDLLLKEGEYYQSAGYRSDSTRMAEVLLETYPKDEKTYDYAIKCYLQYEMYQECYEVLDVAAKRHITSDLIKKTTEQLKYRYEVESRSIEQINAWNSPYYVISRDGYMGYCTQSAQSLIKCQYVNAGIFVNSVAPVTDANANTYYIDIDGNKKLNIPTELKCEKAGPLINDTAVLLCNGKYGYYNGQFKHKFGSYDYAGTMYNGVAAVKDRNAWHLINDGGKKINNANYADIKLNDIEVASMGDVVFAKVDKKYVMLTPKGKQIGKGQYDDAVCFTNSEYTAVKIGDKWGFIDKEGKTFIEPQYEDAKPFTNELAAVKMNGKWGYIDLNNKVVIECIFDDCLNFNNSGFAFVKESGQDEYSILRLLSKNH